MRDCDVLCSARLVLAPFSERHLTDEYLSWLRDPELMRYSEQRFRVHTVESCRRYLESFKGTANRFWALEETALGLSTIGTMTAYVAPADAVADLGILVGKADARRRGYGLEAWRLVCRHLLDNGGMRKISAGTLSVNEPMLRLMRQSGMTPDGVRRRHVLFEGRAVDVVHMALFGEQEGVP